MEDAELVRIKSGIPALDAIMEGGFPFPSTVLVAGSAGTGKTTFCLQFLSEGARNGEQGLFFTTLSESTQWMLRFVSKFSFIKKEYFGKQIKYVDLGAMLLEDKGPKEILAQIEEAISEIMPQRIVIDPITVVMEMVPRGDYRKFLYRISTQLKNWYATTVLTGEVLPNESYPTEISYIVDSIILLSHNESKDEGIRRKYIEILKMRGTDHSSGRNLLNITKEGLSVHQGLR